MVRPTLSLVIGGLVAVIVLIVAVITLAITYSVSLATVRDIGKKHALALATTARVQNEEFFLKPAKDCEALASVFKHDGNDIPTSLPDQTAIEPKERLMYSMYTIHRASGFAYTALGFVFEDGSAGAAVPTDGGETVEINVRFSHQVFSGGNMSTIFRKYNQTTNREIPVGDTLYGRNADGRFGAYRSAVSIMRLNPNGAWYPVQVFRAPPATHFIYPAVMPIFNQTNQFIGLVSLSLTIGKISEFLHAVKGTPNTEVFAVPSDGYLVGSTHSVPFERVFQVADTSVLVGPGCSTSADTQYESETGPIFHGCRERASRFPYAPLQKAAEDRAFMTAAATELRAMDVDGEPFYVVSSPVRNPFRFWGLNIVLCMPEADILGDIVAGRNLAIGVTAAVFVVAALLSFGLVYALLQPLSTVSRRMLDTARLRDKGGEEAQFSSLAEIQDLQRAYSNMNTAIKSFTRYVPRDVVKDLMKSGQLCEIRMVPQQCTMLFVDIAGFTTVCERVPPDVLSDLVSQYFDRASRIVMEHDGLIDKYIGDCIMAVWGAPFAVASQEVKATLTAKLLDRATMVAPLSTVWDAEGELLRVRVGVSTGEVLAGNMGSADRMNYTVIGDPVNLAARLESLNKQFGTRVMVSEMTAERLAGVFVLRLLLPIAVVGKEKPVRVFEVMGLAPDAPNAACVDASTELAAAAARDGRSDAASDLSTVVSVGTRNGGGGGGRAKRRTTAQMLTDALFSTAAALPVACGAEEAAFAAGYSQAVAAYMAGEFAPALERLGALEQQHPSLCGGKSEKSAGLLRELCEAYVREGAPQGFDGVYRALEK